MRLSQRLMSSAGDIKRQQKELEQELISLNSAWEKQKQAVSVLTVDDK